MNFPYTYDELIALLKQINVNSVEIGKLKDFTESIKQPIRLMGRIDSYNDLPQYPNVGDMWFVGSKDASEKEIHVFTESKKWEYLGTTSIDLDGFIKYSDVPTSDKCGPVKVNYENGIISTFDGTLEFIPASKSDIDRGDVSNRVLVPDNIKYFMETYNITKNSIRDITDKINKAYTLSSWSGSIPSYSNLDTYRIPGIYTSETNEVSETIVNAPTKVAFKLLVEYNSTSSNILHIIKDDNNNIFTRIYSIATGSFSPWTRVATSVDIDELSSNVKPAKAVIDKIIANTMPTNDINISSFTPNTYWDIHDNKASRKSAVTYSATEAIDVKPYDVLKITINGNIMDGYSPIVITDDDFNVVYKYETTEVGIINTTVIVPENGAHLMLTNYSTGMESNPVYPSVSIVTYDKLATVNYVESIAGFHRFKNTKLAIVGDDISALKNHIREGNEPYYTGENAGVKNVDDMWYKKVADVFNMEVITVDAGKGKQVTDITDIDLNSADDEPDTIIIFIGVNDFINDSADVTLFANSYKTMVDNILSKYIDTNVYCCSLPMFINNEDRYATETTIEDITSIEYNTIIRNVCEVCGCHFIDLSKSGITRHNIYPTYCEDNANKPLHPNSLGQTKYADCIIRYMRNSL